MIIVQKSSESKLVELLGIINDPSDWQAAHFHLSDLLEQYKSEYQFKIALNLIYDLLKVYEGGIYQMSDHSIIAVCNELDKNVLGKLVFQLRYLYMDDPLSYLDDGAENPNFCTTYDLRTQWHDFMSMCGQRMALLVRKNSAPERSERDAIHSSGVGRNFPPTDNSSANNVRDYAKTNFNVTRLVGVERDLECADIQRVIRRQPICVVSPAMNVRKVLDEMYINISHLRRLLRVDVDFLSNRWLFKYLTQLLDIRMLDLIRRNLPRYVDSPVSLNLNVETIISKHFIEFDSAIKPSSKVSIVIEIPIMDVFADINAFHIARRDLQRLGYRVCLDGLSVESFLMIDREKLGVDLAKVQWNADIEEDLNSKENKDIIKAVSGFGSNRVILCRCDNKDAVQYGQALGISLFQGRYIDSILTPNAKIAN
jgi:EAL domain-containing protein (putative c-di-GMP-specific phosphodiesterase class I)